MKQRILLKSLCACLVVLCPLASTLFAQVIPTRKVIVPGADTVERADAIRFNLNFPGGSPQELIAALGEAMGTPVNAFIPEGAEQFKMPTLNYHNVTVGEVLSSLRHSESIPVAEYDDNGNRTLLRYHEVGYQWYLSQNIWVMGTEVMLQEIPPPPVRFLVQPFSIGDLLDIYTIDAITTTIDSAWKLNGASEENEIMFHPDTKILLVKCPEKDMQCMQQVLKTLYDTLPEEVEEVEEADLMNVNILGAVNRPGNYTMGRGATLTYALAEAGGPSRLANIKSLTIKYLDKTTDVNFSKILNGESADIKLQKGATVVVPERVL